MTVIEFKPKGRRAKITNETALKQILELNPTEMVVVARVKDELVAFHSGHTGGEMLWLLEQVKLALINGELGE